jgi:DNA-binding NarL/FixJ family response regulator
MKKSGIIIASNSEYFTDKVRELLSATCKGENILVISGNDDIVETIQRTKPRIVFIESNCWHQVTALVIWECANKFPLLNIAVWNVEALTVEGAGRFICVGAQSYIDIRKSIIEAREAFRIVASGNSYIPPEIEAAAAAYALPDTERPGLTSVEIKIIRLCFFGKSEREISSILNLSYGTVRVYIAKIYQKCALRNKCDLFLFAIQTGIVLVSEFHKARYKSLDSLVKKSLAEKKLEGVSNGIAV